MNFQSFVVSVIPYFIQCNPTYIWTYGSPMSLIDLILKTKCSSTYVSVSATILTHIFKQSHSVRFTCPLRLWIATGRLRRVDNHLPISPNIQLLKLNSYRLIQDQEVNSRKYISIADILKVEKN